MSGIGWRSLYIEDMVGSMLASMVLEGVFVRFLGLRVVSIRTGFSAVYGL